MCSTATIAAVVFKYKMSFLVVSVTSSFSLCCSDMIGSSTMHAEKICMVTLKCNQFSFHLLLYQYINSYVYTC